MALYRYYLFISLLMLLSCQVESIPLATTTSLISAYGNLTAQRNFDQCTFRYAFRNSPKTLTISNLQKSLEVPFDQWQQANGYIDFVPVAANAPAEISFVFSDSIQTGTARTEFGLIGQPIRIVSQLNKQTNGTYTVHLSDTYPWDVGSLQRVMLFQIGAALGLAISAMPSSAMYPRITTNSSALDASDVKAVQQLYDLPCDQWTRLPNLPFDSFYAETTFSLQNSGYVLLNALFGNNSLWEFTATTTSWRQRAPYPTYEQEIFAGIKCSFSIGNAAFVGEGYETFTNYRAGQFWRYEPASDLIADKWVRVADLPQKGEQTAKGFSLNNQGYVVALQKDTLTRTTLNVVWTYAPALNKWSQSTDFQRPVTNPFELEGSKLFVLNQQVYLINNRFTNWQFDPLQATPWRTIATFEPTSYPVSSTAFTVRGIGYYVFDTSDTPPVEHVWKYTPTRGWVRVKDFPGAGNRAFSFVVNNRAYVGTRTGQFWMYRP